MRTLTTAEMTFPRQNFDCRPPTCLVQSTRVLQEGVFDPAQLANLRHPHLIPSRSDRASFHLVGRCSRGTLVHARARRLDALVAGTRSTAAAAGSAKRERIFHDPPTYPTVNLVGTVRQLRATADGKALLVQGENGRVQSWEMGIDEVVTDMTVGEAGVPLDAKLATWHDGQFPFAGSRFWRSRWS